MVVRGVMTCLGAPLPVIGFFSSPRPPPHLRRVLPLLPITPRFSVFSWCIEMLPTFINVALFAAFALQGALADFTIDTPTFTQVCVARFHVAPSPHLRIS
jgi:hypothetical protein